MLGMDITTYSSLVIAIGGLVYGVDTGIIATTIAHDSFKTYILYAKGDVQWRVPLAMQIPPAALLLVLTIFLPDSPRWLVTKERHEDAQRVITMLHAKKGEEFIQREMLEIREQLALEQAQRTSAS
ncbi:hypothetical protein LZL87_014036 [Fusarium oxysporum]|nr:hypothetical protein LZL87_014036 [Fusarium oxysporum]